MQKKLKNFVEEQFRNDQFSGVVLIAKDEEVILGFVCGFANKEKQIHPFDFFSQMLYYGNTEFWKFQTGGDYANSI